MNGGVTQLSTKSKTQSMIIRANDGDINKETISKDSGNENANFVVSTSLKQ